MAVDMDMVVVDVVLDYLRLSSAKNFSISFEFSLTHYYSFASLPHTHTPRPCPRIYDYHGFTIQLTLFALRVALIYFHLIQFAHNTQVLLLLFWSLGWLTLHATEWYSLSCNWLENMLNSFTLYSACMGIGDVFEANISGKRAKRLHDF